MVLLTPMLDRGPIARAAGLSTLARAGRRRTRIAPWRSSSRCPTTRGSTSTRSSIKNQARLDLAAFLARPPGERWDRITDRLLHLWVVGDEDSF